MIIVAMFFMGCPNVIDQDIVDDADDLFDGDSNWELIFEDNFNGDSLDDSKWSKSTGAGFARVTAWGKESLAHVKEGRLIMPLVIFEDENPRKDKKTDNFDKKYHGAEVKTKEKFYYGKYSVSMKCTEGGGQLSTFFTYAEELKDGVNYVNEIDFEIIGDKRNTVSVNNWNSPADNLVANAFKARPDITTWEKFHEYTFIWLEKGIYFYVNGKLVHFTDVRVPEFQTSLFLNRWMSNWGPVFGGIIDDSKVPANMEVEWVKVWKLKEGAVSPEIPEEPEEPKEPDVSIPESDWPTPVAEEVLEGWDLVYRDNFDTLDEKKWAKIATDAPSVTTYGDTSLATVVEGKLVLTLQDNLNTEDAVANPYQGTKIESVQKFKHGKMVARMKSRADNGQFLTFMLSGSSVLGETQVINFQTKYAASKMVIELNDYTGAETGAVAKTPTGVNYTEFNTYGIEWAENSVKYYLNDKLIHTTEDNDLPNVGIPISFSYWMGHWVV